jgi:hypothetical protein
MTIKIFFYTLLLHFTHDVGKHLFYFNPVFANSNERQGQIFFLFFFITTNGINIQEQKEKYDQREKSELFENKFFYCTWLNLQQVKNVNYVMHSSFLIVVYHSNVEIKKNRDNSYF